MPFDAGALAGPGSMDFASFVGQSVRRLQPISLGKRQGWRLG
jgi:hypothetical protein